ncbi:MAG: hypothetical protein IJT07_03235, partial [Oscillospiraceae bacterium]|nr:hypothetical protein [Oscillospiraceae bacterium]
MQHRGTLFRWFFPIVAQFLSKKQDTKRKKVKKTGGRLPPIRYGARSEKRAAGCRPYGEGVDGAFVGAAISRPFDMVQG